MIANSVEKHCFVMLKLKLQIKIRPQTFCWFLELSTSASPLKATTNTAFFPRKLWCPYNKHLIYGQEPNLWNQVLKIRCFFKNFNKPTYIDSIEIKAKGTISPRGNRLSIPIFKTISKPLGKNGMKKKHLKSKRI